MFMLLAILSLGFLFGLANIEQLQVYADTQHTVTFDYNAGALSPNLGLTNDERQSITNRTIKRGTGYLTNVNQYNPRIKCYSFKWTYNGQPVDLASVEINKDTTFVISWTPVKYHVDFLFANDTIKSMVTNLVERIEFTVESPRIELYKPNIPNYNFDGWYSGTTHIDMLYLPAGSFGDKIYTARFTPKEFTIDYHTDAKNTDNPKHYNVTDSAIILAEPSQEGHIFLGWYSDSDYTTKVAMIDTTKGGNINLYPLWELEKYTVTYILPDGYSRKVEVEYGKKAELPEVKKNIFDIIVTDVSRKNITEDTTIRIKVVNIWYVYVLGVAAIVGIVAAIVINRKKREEVHDSLRDRYQARTTKPTRATVSIIEKRPIANIKTTTNLRTTTVTKTTNTKPTTKVDSKPIRVPQTPKPITRNNPATSLANKIDNSARTNKTKTKK